jgi:hypothetical protein
MLHAHTPQLRLLGYGHAFYAIGDIHGTLNF